VLVGWGRTKGLGTIRNECLKFCSHSLLPPRVTNCFPETGGFGFLKNGVKGFKGVSNGVVELKVWKGLRFEGASSSSGGHWMDNWERE